MACFMSWCHTAYGVRQKLVLGQQLSDKSYFISFCAATGLWAGDLGVTNLNHLFCIIGIIHEIALYLRKELINGLIWRFREACSLRYSDFLRSWKKMLGAVATALVNRTECVHHSQDCHKSGYDIRCGFTTFVARRNILTCSPKLESA